MQLWFRRLLRTNKSAFTVAKTKLLHSLESQQPCLLQLVWLTFSFDALSPSICLLFHVLPSPHLTFFFSLPFAYFSPFPPKETLQLRGWPINAMSSTTYNGDEAPRQPWHFHSALRWDKLPLWRQTVQANDFGVMNAVLCISVDGVLLSTEDQASLWRDFKYPRGIRVLHKWTATHLPYNELDGYNGMSRDALVNFADAVGE